MSRRGGSLAARAVVPLAVLLALNAAVFFAFTLPRTLTERSLEQRLQTLEGELQRERERVAAQRERQALLAANARDTTRFFSERLRPAREALVPLLSELEQLATRAGLALGDQRFSPKRMDAGPLLRMEISVPVRGDYAALGQLLGALEGSSQLVVVDRIELRGGTGAGRELALNLSAYFAAEEAGGMDEAGAPR